MQRSHDSNNVLRSIVTGFVSHMLICKLSGVQQNIMQMFQLLLKIYSIAFIISGLGIYI